eukprot:scaffold344814_cov63-Attheya_sp.AAC.2
MPHLQNFSTDTIAKTAPTKTHPSTPIPPSPSCSNTRSQPWTSCHFLQPQLPPPSQTRPILLALQDPPKAVVPLLTLTWVVEDAALILERLEEDAATLTRPPPLTSLKSPRTPQYMSLKSCLLYFHHASTNEPSLPPPKTLKMRQAGGLFADITDIPRAAGLIPHHTKPRDTTSFKQLLGIYAAGLIPPAIQQTFSSIYFLGLWKDQQKTKIRPIGVGLAF